MCLGGGGERACEMFKIVNFTLASIKQNMFCNYCCLIRTTTAKSVLQLSANCDITDFDVAKYLINLNIRQAP